MKCPVNYTIKWQKIELKVYGTIPTHELKQRQCGRHTEASLIHVFSSMFVIYYKFFFHYVLALVLSRLD